MNKEYELAQDSLPSEPVPTSATTCFSGCGGFTLTNPIKDQSSNQDHQSETSSIVSPNDEDNDDNDDYACDKSS